MSNGIMWKFASLVLLLGTLACAAEPQTGRRIKWVNHYGKARQLSGKTNRPVLLFLTTENCIHCTRMQQSSFRDKDVVGDLTNNFVPAKLKLNASSSLAKDLRVTIYPTTVMIAPDGKILDYVRGYISPAELRSRLTSVSHSSTAIASRTDQ